METKPIHKPEFAKSFNQMMEKMADKEGYELWRFKSFLEEAKKRNNEVFVFIETEVSEDPTVILLDNIDILDYSEERGHFVFNDKADRNKHVFWGGIKRETLPDDFKGGCYFDANLVKIPKYKEPTIADVLALEPVGEMDLWTLFETIESDLREGTYGVDWVEKDEKERLKVSVLVNEQNNSRGYTISKVEFDNKVVAILYIDNSKEFDVLDAEGYQAMLNYIEDEWGCPIKTTPLDKSLMGYFGEK